MGNWQVTPVSIRDPGTGEAVNVESNGGLAVNIQDQHTEIIDLHASQLIQAAAIAVDTSIDDTTVTITTAAEPTNGNIICLKEQAAFYQGGILSHAANGADWDIVVDTPLDYPYTTVGGCSERNDNLAVDGSVTPVLFTISPANLSPGIEWDVVRMIFQITDDTSMDDGKFGGITALTNGIVIRSVNGITKNLFNAKTNADMAGHMYDIAYSDRSPAGTFGFRARRTFGGQSKNGVTIRLDADTEDVFEVIVQDDLTGLTSFLCIIQGHAVGD